MPTTLKFRRGSTSFNDSLTLEAGEVFEFLKETILQLGRNDMGTEPQTFTLLAATVSSNKDVFASLSWVEIR